MAKNKGIYRLFRTKAEFMAFKHEVAHFHRTFMLDFVVIALGRLGWGETRLERFDKVLDEVVGQYMQVMGEDLNDDKDMIYSRELMERELKQYTGKLYAPPEKRYEF